MLRQRLIRFSVIATLATTIITAAVDCHIGVNGGASYLHSLIGRHGTEPHVLSGLRDGLAANIVFFALVGFATAYATTRDAKEEVFVQRLLAMFPMLDRHADLIKPIMSLVKEDASITREAILQLHLLKYDAAARAYTLSVYKKETMVSLLQNEAYEDEDFMISVDSDVVPGYERLGDVKEAKITPIGASVGSGNNDSALRNAPVLPIDFLKQNQSEITAAKSKWSIEDERITIHPGHEALLTLRYEIMSIVGVPFTSQIRRPARTIRVEFFSSIDSRSPEHPAPRIEATVTLKSDGKPQTRRFQRSHSELPAAVVEFTPSKRRPKLSVVFTAPEESFENQRAASSGAHP